MSVSSIPGFQKFAMVAMVLALVAFAAFSANVANAQVTPPSVDLVLAPGQSELVNKKMPTPASPPVVHMCLLEDETGSFNDDIANLQSGTTASDIYDTVVAASPSAQFAVAGFRDYPVNPYGSPGDWVYRLLSGMSPVKANWLAGIAALTAGGGNDIPEAQYDAIVAAATGAKNCGWSGAATRILVVTTDARFHLPGAGKPHVNNHASTVAALNAQNIIVIGLKAAGAGGELDLLATATGGSVQALNSDGSNIGAAIVAGLGNLPITVTPVAVGCDPLNISWAPASQTVTSGTDVNFVEKIAVPANSALAGQTVVCTVEFRDENGNVLGVQDVTVEIPLDLDASPNEAINELGFDFSHDVNALVSSNGVPLDGLTVSFDISSGPNAGANGSDVTDGFGSADFSYPASTGGTDTIDVCVIGADGTSVCETVTKKWADTTPPTVRCEPGNNPASNEPQAPANGDQGQNQDGFYTVSASDRVDPDPQIFVVDMGTDNVFGTADDYTFGPYSSPTNIKYTEANGADPSEKPGSGDVDYNLKGQGDAAVYAVDFSDNSSDPVICRVPNPPK